MRGNMLKVSQRVISNIFGLKWYKTNQQETQVSKIPSVNIFW